MEPLQLADRQQAPNRSARSVSYLQEGCVRSAIAPPRSFQSTFPAPPPSQISASIKSRERLYALLQFRFASAKAPRSAYVATEKIRHSIGFFGTQGRGVMVSNWWRRTPHRAPSPSSLRGALATKQPR